MIFRRLLMLVFLVVAVCVTSAGVSAAAVITVDDSGGADFMSIQAAVDAASEGDTIEVRIGTYLENIRIDKDLMVEAEDRKTTIIDGGGSANCIYINYADVIISGFTIKNVSGYGIYASGSDFSLNNATIMDCEKDAVYFSSGKSLTLRDSVLENCGGGLIYNHHYDSFYIAKGNATIERNIIKNNGGSGLDIYLKDKGNNIIINDNSITNNTGYGIKCDSYSSYSKIDSIEMKNNTVKDSQNCGVYLTDTVDVNISDITIENAGSNGLYISCQKLTMNPSFSIKNVGGYGIRVSGSDFSLNNATIMDCEKDAVYFSSGKSLTLRDSVLENCGGGLIYNHHYDSFYIAKGNATIERNIIKNNGGSGLDIYLKDKGNNIIINDNSITNNTGYGIKCDSYSSYSKIDSIEMKNNTVKDSQNCGVYLTDTVDVNISDITIENAGSNGLYISCQKLTMNPSFSIKNVGGYGIRVSGSDFSLNNATIMDCEKDAVYYSSGKSLTLRDSVLENCGGGLIYGDHALYLVAKGNATIERNIIKNNNGSGLYVYLKDKGNNVIINDNSIINNTGYGIKCDSYSSYSKIDSIDMRNNTVKNSGDDGVCIENTMDVSISDLTIENAGTGGLYVYCQKLTMNPPFSIKNISGYGISASGSDFSLNNATIMDCEKDAVYFSSGKSLTLRDSVLENCGGGLIYGDHALYLVAKGNATIERNIIKNNNGSGLYVYLKDKGNNVIINDNSIINNTGYGIKCDSYSSYSKIDSIDMRNNTVKNSGDDGVYILRAEYFTLFDNAIVSNEGHGISLHSSDSSLIFHNNLVNNNPNAYDSNSASNDWHHPILLEGNYWSDYTGIDDGSGTGKHDIVGDGIGDMDISHPDANYDYYPFVNESCWAWPKLNTIQVHTDKKFYGLNKPVTISCIVQNDTGVNISVDTIIAEIVKPDNLTEWITLFEGSTGNCEGTFTNTSLFGIYNITIYAYKVGYLVYNNSKLCFEVLPDHDIAVTNINAPSSSETNSTIIVNATISNIGLNNESDVTVDFIVDGVKQDAAIIASLEIRSRTNVSFQWTAPVGRHNILIYSEPVVNETILWNNKLDKLITIADIWVPDNYPTIQQAVDNATAGNMIVIRDGTYPENIYVNKQLTIQSENGSLSTITRAFDVNTNYVNISGFTVRSSQSRKGIYLNGVDHCIISNNTASNNHHGIYLLDSNYNTIINNNACSNHGFGASGRDGTYGGNGRDGYGYGIYLNSSNKNTLVNNNASSNSGIGGKGGNGGGLGHGGDGGYGYGYGIYLKDSNNNALMDNIANSNIGRGGSGGKCRVAINVKGGYAGHGNDGYCYGIYLEDSNNNTLIGNTANKNRGLGGGGGLGNDEYRSNGGNSASGYCYGIYLMSSSNNTLTDNDVSLNDGSGGYGGSGYYGGNGGDGYGSGIYMLSSSHNTLSKNTANSNKGKGGDGADGNYGGDGGDGYGCGIYQKYSSYITYISNIASSNKGYGGSGAYGSFMYGEDGHGYSYNQPQTDTTPPVISNIANTTPTTNSVTITWDTDENSNSLVRYGTVSGTYTNIESGTSMATSHSITLTGLNPETTYYFVVNSTDTNGNSNQSVEYSFITAIPDTTPPSSVTKLHSTIGITYLNWTWTNPSDPDFNHTELYLNDTFLTNIPAPQNYYNATGLLTDTSYELSTRTVDINGNINLTWVNDTASTLLASGTTLNLYIGWNLISLPLMPEDTSITSLLSPINGNYSIVWAYNASDTADHWKKYDPGAPFGNDLTTMEAGKGYWIMMTSNDTLFVTGDVPGSTDIILKAGWNLIGYNSLVGQPIENALASVSGNYSIIWAYDTSDTADHWKKYDPGAPFGNDLANMEVGKGYWIMMTTDDILEI